MQRCLCLTLKPSGAISRPFTTSAVSQEKKRKRIARLKKQANLEKRNSLQQQLHATRPDPLLGYHDKALWDQSRIKGLILSKNQVWNASLDATSSSSSRALAASLDEGLGQDTTYQTPERFNFGLDAQDADLLFRNLPDVAAERPVLVEMGKKGSAVSSDQMQKLHEEGVQEEGRKREQLMRILDLKNANARGIRFENTRRVLEAFGRPTKDGNPDTGSPEVQAAVLTMRIHNLRDHLVQNPKDKFNLRAIVSLITKRNSLLRYLKRKSIQRYTAALSALGLEPRAVEGEFIFTQPEARKLKEERVTA